MSKYSIDQLFRLADLNKNNYVNATEWQSFYKVFLRPFLDCTNNSWSIDKTNYQCVLDSKYFDSEFLKNHSHTSIDPLHTFRNGILSFADYIFVRSSANAYKKCAMSGDMTWNGLRCGIMRVSGIPYVNQGDIHNIFELIKEWNGDHISSINFESFLRVGRYFYIFNA